MQRSVRRGYQNPDLTRGIKGIKKAQARAHRNPGTEWTGLWELSVFIVYSWGGGQGTGGGSQRRCIQISKDKEAGLLYTAGEGGRFSSSLWEQSLHGSSLQAINTQWEKVTADIFYTHCQCLHSDLGKALPSLSINTGEDCHCHGTGILDVANSGLHLLRAASAPPHPGLSWSGWWLHEQPSSVMRGC